MAEPVKAPRKGFETWTVVGQPSIDEVSDSLWIVQGEVPGMSLNRFMVVARMEDGRLLLHNPVALPPADIARLDALGEVGYLVVPNGWHRLDAKPFAARYPDAEVVCPAGARTRVEQVVPVDLTYDQFESDSVVSLRHVPGLGDSEGMLTVTEASGKTLVFNDALFNMDHQPGLFGLVFRLLGSTGGPRVTRLFRTMVVKDKQVLRAFLQQQAGTHGLVRLVPGHGKVITEAPKETLLAVAERL